MVKVQIAVFSKHAVVSISLVLKAAVREAEVRVAWASFSTCSSGGFSGVVLLVKLGSVDWTDWYGVYVNMICTDI